MNDTIAMDGKNSGGIEQQHPIGVLLPVPAGTESGDVVLVSTLGIVVYAQTDRDSDGYATCYVPGFFAEVITVYGTDDSGDVAVAVGDWLAHDVASDQVNKDYDGNIIFGWAAGTVVSGSSAEIMVVWTSPWIWIAPQ